MIVAVFWGVLLPYYMIVIKGDADAVAALDMEVTPDTVATNVIDHSFCLLCLCIDWAINSIYLDYRHMTIIYGIALTYCAFNVVWCEMKKEYIYPIMDWVNDPLFSSITVLCTFFLMTAVFVLLKVCTDYKLRRFESLSISIVSKELT